MRLSIILENIVAIPSLQLPPASKHIVLDIIKDLPDETSDEFQKALDNYKGLPLSNKIIANVCAYLDAWHAIIAKLRHWNGCVAKAWVRQTSKELGNDNLLPLTINHLPYNESLLKKAFVQMEGALEVLGVKGEAAFILTNFFTGVAVRLKEKNTDIELEDMQVVKVSDELDLRADLDDIAALCQKYLLDLAISIASRLKLIDESIYKQIFGSANSEDEIREQVEKLHLYRDQNAFEATDKVINQQLDWYLAITSLLHSLQREGKGAYKSFEEFSEKLIVHEPTLREGDVEGGAKLVSYLSIFSQTKNIYSPTLAERVKNAFSSGI